MIEITQFFATGEIKIDVVYDLVAMRNILDDSSCDRLIKIDIDQCEPYFMEYSFTEGYTARYYADWVKREEWLHNL